MNLLLENSTSHLGLKKVWLSIQALKGSAPIHVHDLNLIN